VIGDGTRDDQDPGAPRDDSVDGEALQLLARRPLTAAELRARLESRGHPPSAVERAVARLERAGHLDDCRLAAHFIVARAERLGHGPRRLVEDLKRRGLTEEEAEAAWRAAVERGDVDPDRLLRREIRRRVGGSAARLDRRHFRRVYNALLRAGFEASRIEEQLAPLRAAAGAADEVGDDFA
jgi:regulatory protein